MKLCDFGFAKIDQGDLMTPQFTPYYVAPQVSMYCFYHRVSLSYLWTHILLLYSPSRCVSQMGSASEPYRLFSLVQAFCSFKTKFTEAWFMYNTSTLSVVDEFEQMDTPAWSAPQSRYKTFPSLQKLSGVPFQSSAPSVTPSPRQPPVCFLLLLVSCFLL